MHCADVFLEAGEGKASPGWCWQRSASVLSPSWGTISKCHGTSGFGRVLLLCVERGLTMPPPQIPLSTQPPPHTLRNLKRKEGKNREVSLEDYCHTAVTVTVPCGQYGGGIGRGPMVGWGGGGPFEHHSPHSLTPSLSLSLLPPSSSQTPLPSLVISSIRGER